MTDDTCREWRRLLGAYVVDQLTAAERVAVEAHLDGCADCRAELEQISAVLPALREIDPDAIAVAEVPSPELGERVFAQIAVEQRQQRRQQVARGLAAAAVLIGVVGFASLLRPTAPAVPVEQVALQVVAPSVEADAELIAHTWGTELILDAKGFADGAAYDLAFRRADGTVVDGGTFLGVGARPLVCRMNAAVKRADAVGFVIRDGAGRVVIEAALPPPPERA